MSVLCGAVCAACVCDLPEGHESPHLCEPHCRGSWTGDDRTGEAKPGPIYGPNGWMLPQFHAFMDLRWDGEAWQEAADKASDNS